MSASESRTAARRAPRSGGKAGMSTVSEYHILDRMERVKPADRKLPATIFRDVQASRKEDVELSIREIKAKVETTVANSKQRLPLLKFARFGNDKTGKGSLRHDANMLTIDGIEGDYDREQMTIPEAARKLGRAGITALLYESPSSTPKRPRWRVICPCSKSLPPEDREALVARLNGILGGVLDGASFTLSQSFYFGGIASKPAPETELVEGDYIDLRDDLDAGSMGRNAGPVARHHDGDGGKLDRSDMAWELAMDLHHENEPKATFLRRINNDSILKTWAKEKGERQIDRAWERSKAEYDKEHERIRSLFDDLGPPEVEQESQSRKRSTLRVHYVSDLKSLPPFKHLIRDTISIGALSALIGTPGVGKTFVALDMLLHIATGKPWFGKSVARGSVIIVALEGARGMWKRIRAWCERHRVDPDTLPVVVIDGSLNLRKDKAARQEIIDAAHELAERTGLAVRAIVIDTLNRAMFGGNESASEDMGALIAGADHIRVATGGHVMLVHHLGKDEGRGARGHSSLFGAVDTELTVEEKGKLKITKQKEGEDGTRFAFRLEQVDLGDDDEGNSVTSQVLVHDSRVTFDDLEADDMGERVSAALKVLRKMNTIAKVIDHEHDVALDEFRATLKNSNWPKADFKQEAFRKAWERLLENPKFLEHVQVERERITCKP